MDDATALVGDLIAEATGLVERPAEADDPQTLAQVHDALAAAVAECADPALASDAKDVLALLDGTVQRLELRRDFPLAS